MCQPMRLETKFLRLKTPVTIGSRFGDWEVCWLGGWIKHRFCIPRNGRSSRPMLRKIRRRIDIGSRARDDSVSDYRDARNPRIRFASQPSMVVKYAGTNRCNDGISLLLPIFASNCA